MGDRGGNTPVQHEVIEEKGVLQREQESRERS